MPFVTEELWQHMNGREAMLIESNWPDLSTDLIDLTVESEMDWVVRLIGEVRAVRAEMNVPVKAEIGLWLNGAGEENLRRLRANEEAIIRLARLEVIQEEDQEVPTGAVQIVFDEATIVLPLAKVIDIGIFLLTLVLLSARIMYLLEEEYDLKSVDKALRCILDYVALDGDWEEIDAK